MRPFILFLSVILPSTVFSISIKECLNVFKNSKQLKYNLSSDVNLRDPYSQKLFSVLYPQIEKTSFLSQGEKQKFISETEKTINFIESHLNNKNLEGLREDLLPALSAFPEIFGICRHNTRRRLLSSGYKNRI